MDTNLVATGPHKDFEKIKKTDSNGIEFWTARELMPLLGYLRWENFEEVVGKAAKACIESGQNVDNHFRDITKMVKIGLNTMREVSKHILWLGAKSDRQLKI